MTKKDLLELKKRFKKEACTISRLTGCYVDGDKNKVLKFNENFLNMREEELHKYMEIAKKTLTGAIGNNVLELEFPLEEENPGGKQQYLYALRESNLDNDDLLDRLYDLIIDGYQYVGNYLILVFHDTYDIMTRTSDNNKLDESEEVYDYLLVSVCPVALSKAGLGYRQDENRIGARIRDWVVGVPDIGFLFPAFDNRSQDIHQVDYFIRDAKDSHPEFVEDVLGCGAKKTATEQRLSFQSIVKRVYGLDEEAGEAALIGIQESLNAKVDTGEEKTDAQIASIILDEATIEEVLKENDVEEDKAKLIKEICKEEFEEEVPVVNLIDTKALQANAKEKEKKELVKEVATLKTELAEKKKELEESITGEEVKNYDIVVRVKPEKATQIKSSVIDGQKCLVIPMNDNENCNVNGVNTTV